MSTDRMIELFEQKFPHTKKWYENVIFFSMIFISFDLVKATSAQLKNVTMNRYNMDKDHIQKRNP